MQGGDGGDGRGREAEHHGRSSLVEHPYAIRATKSRCSKMNFPLIHGLLFLETYLLWYCASPRLAEIQSIYLLVRDFSSLRTELWLRWTE